MRNRAFGLSILFVFSLVVTACGGSSADIKKVGLVTDVGPSRTSPSTRRRGSAPRRAPRPSAARPATS